MADQQRTSASPPEEAPGKPEAGKENVGAGELENHPPIPTANEPSRRKELTAEEQMDLYEKELKETDWGHQPC